MLENRFKTKLIKEIEDLFPGCMVLHLDANEYQGIPDILILYKDKWAALEGKQYAGARQQPNQAYYIDLMDEMSFARIIHPGNKEEILNELQQAFRCRGTTRILKR
jgi:hypothetical protein